MVKVAAPVVGSVSGTCKAGFARDGAPLAISPSPGILDGMDHFGSSVQDGIARACSSVALLCCSAFSATAVHGSQQEVGFGGQFVRGSLEGDFEGSTSTIRDMDRTSLQPILPGRSFTIRC